MYSLAIITRLNAIAESYREQIERAVIDVLSEPSFKASGAGVESVQVDVIKGDASKAPQITIKYEDYLGFLNMRGLQWTRQPNVEKLTVWAENKNFTSIPGYSKGGIPTFGSAERVAWAIAKNKQKNDTWKTKKWRKRSLSKVLKTMNEQIIQAYELAIEEELQKAVNV